MSRSLPVWLLASALAALVGCGGGSGTDAGAVATGSNDAAATGGAAPMPTADSGMAPGGGSDAMGSAGGMEMTYGSNDGNTDDPSADMTADMYGAGSEGYPGGTPNYDDPTMDPAAMAAAYETGSDSSGSEDAAMAASMAAAYTAGGEDSSGATTGISPEEMAARYGAPGAEGADPSGAAGEYPGAAAYPGGEYPGGPGGGAVEEKVPEGFDGKAQWAFRRGKEKDAMQFLYAYALTTDAGAESVLPTIRWVGGLREPKLAVRWGVGFVVTAPRNFAGDPKPVGSEQNIPTRGGAAAGGGEGFAGGGAEAGYDAPGGEAGYGSGGGGGGGAGSNALLSQGAGELGDKLVAAYRERVMRGDFGDVLKKAMESGSGGSPGGPGGSGPAGYGAGGSAGYPGPGSAGPGSADTDYGAKAGAEGGGRDAAAATTQVTQIMPGLSMLGIGTQKELIDRARADEINAVVIIDMKLRVSTTGLVTNESTLALLDAKTQKKLHTTKKFNNLTIQKARAEGKDDGVDKELEHLFEKIDENLQMTDLPAGLTAQVAADRVAKLAAQKHDNPLPILAEARMYHTKGLLEESALFAAYEQILGKEFGRLLATGEEEDKKKVLSQWLPEI